MMVKASYTPYYLSFYLIAFVQDVDECLLGACGYTGQTCVNSVGSFECKCSPGFNQVGYAFGEDMCQGNELIIKNSVTLFTLLPYLHL